MAKITGPLMSLDASGSVAGTITFSKWKGRNYVRQTVTPSNPQSPAQVAFRAMFGFLAQAWKLISAPDQASWQSQADSLKASTFNAYSQTNQKRWTQGQTPEINATITPGAGPLVITGRIATGGVRQITVQAQTLALNDNWGLIIYRNAVTGFAPTQNDVVGVIPWEAPDTVKNFIDSNLTPGTYYYRFATFSHQGEQLLDGTEVNAIAS